MRRSALIFLWSTGFLLTGAEPPVVLPEYNRAWKLVGQLRVDDAIPILKRVIVRDQRFDRAYATLAEAYVLKASPADGEAFFRSLLAADPRNALAYYGLGEIYHRLRQFDAAYDAIVRCVRLDREAFACIQSLIRIDRKKPPELLAVGRDLRPTTTMGALARAALLNHQHRVVESNEIARRGIALAQASGEMGAVIRLERMMGDNSFFLDDLEAVVRHAKEALRVAESLGDCEETFQSRQDLAGSYATAGDVAGGLALQIETIERARRIGHAYLEARGLWALGDHYRNQGNSDQALTTYAQAEKLVQGAGREQTAVNIGLRSASLQFEVGDFSGAATTYERCRAVSSEKGLRWHEAFALKGLANCRREQGSYFKALHLQARAIKIFEGLNRPMNVSATLRDSGAVYAEAGAYGEARRRYALALRTARSTLDREGQQRALLYLADVALREKNPAEALYALHDPALAKRNAAPPQRCRALLYEGTAHLLKGELRHAIRAWEEARRLAEEVRLEPEQAAAETASGSGYLRLGEVSLARERFAASLDRAERIGLARMVPEARKGLGEVSRNQGNDAEALKHFERGIWALESQRSSIPLPELRAGFVHENWSLYEQTIETLWDLSAREPSKRYDRKAFEYAERARARSFLDLLAEAKAHVTKGVTAEQLRQQDRLRARLSKASAVLLKNETASARNAVVDAERELTEWSLELRRTNPAYQQLRYPEPYPAEKAQQAGSRNGSLLLEFALGETRSFAWAVDDSTFRMVLLPGRVVIEDQVRNLRAMLGRRPSAPGAVNDFRRAAAALHDLLLRPLTSVLAKGQALIIVPDGILHYLPFEALVAPNGRYLIENHLVSYAPSASVLGELSKVASPPPRPYALLAYGDPVFAPGDGIRSNPVELVRSVYRGSGIAFAPLPNTRREVQAISRNIAVNHRRLYLGAEATEASVKHEKLSGYRNLHFATHAILDEQNPSLSGIVFSLANTGEEDGVLRVNEIVNLELNADVAVLSACQTGLGKLIRGEGMIGLTRAFLYAGARRVVVSLWAVNDLATADFMGLLYAAMEKASPVRALRETKLSMLRSQVAAYRHPYFWAPFVAVGQP